MILNAFSVLAAFAALLRIVLGLIIAGAGLGALRRRSGDGAAAEERGEERYFLLASLGMALVGLGIASWPLLYLVLQSYVPEWPGIMCIEGVTRIGNGSVGAASSLPPLLGVLQVSKPLVVFACGVWIVLHVAGRRARGAHAGRALAALLVCGALATADAVAELAYLGIPKQETTLASGCCSVGSQPASHTGPLANGSTGLLSAAFWSVGVALVATLASGERRLRRMAAGGRWLAMALGLAIASVPLGVAYLGAVAAPAFLRLPHHRCAYCLIAGAPESLLLVALYASGAFAVGWAAVAAWLAPQGSRRPLALPLLRWARFAYVGALLMVGVRMAIP